MTRVGRYEIERRLGGGGMAEVFLARLVGNEGFSRPVAIKRVLPHLAADESFARMFVSEAQLCAKLQHPNIVSVLDFDRDEEGRPYLVLELVDGPSLAALADTGPVPAAAAIDGHGTPLVCHPRRRILALQHGLQRFGRSVRGAQRRFLASGALDQAEASATRSNAR